MKLVPEVGLEPTRPYGQRILNPSRLPIPPLGQERESRCKARSPSVSTLLSLCSEVSLTDDLFQASLVTW